MAEFCEECDHLHSAGDTVAIGRFMPGGPTYRANYVGAPERLTIHRAARDMCDFRRALHPEPEQEGLFP